MEKHVHYETIIAYANGEDIQFRINDDGKWSDIEHPAFYNRYQYRVKPTAIKYKVALLANAQGVCTYTVANKIEEYRVQLDPFFIRWLTDWVEVEI